MRDQRVDVNFTKCVLKVGGKDVEWIHLAHNNFQRRDVINAVIKLFFSFSAKAQIWALAYLHETLRFISAY
jgi:hypothetical protein